MITVERFSPDKLTVTRWQFFTCMDIGSDTVKIRVHFYGIGKRTTTRHKFIFNKHYNSHDERNCEMKRNEVPIIPKDVAEEIKSSIIFEVM